MKLHISWVKSLYEKKSNNLSLDVPSSLGSNNDLLWILVAYLLGLPILDYSLDIGKEHVNLIDERLEKLIYSGQLDDKELDR